MSAKSDSGGNTNYEYYPGTHVSAGHLKSQTNAAGKKAYFNYNSRGEMVQTWGDTTYPIEYVFDSYGQKTEMHTFRNGAGWTASAWPSASIGPADVTRWIYHEATGFLTQKQDAAGKAVVYTYDEMSRIKTRTWARGVTCTYTYDSNTGVMTGVDYSDSTPVVTLAYDRGGRRKTITDAAGSRERTSTVTGALQTEQITGGILDAVSLNVGYDNFLRRNSLQSSNGANVLNSQTYGYDSASRLQTVTNGGQTETYVYYPNSGLLNTTTFTTGMQTSRNYDPLGRIQSIATTTPASETLASGNYQYNSLNQRYRVTREDGSYWLYTYNDRGELVAGRKYWGDNTPVWGAQTEDSYDNLGNRTAAKSGGNQLNQLRQASYTANSLNQYAQRTNPAAVDVSGAANIAATVSVNDQTTVRKGDYFYKELAIGNTTGPVYQQVTVVGARQNFGAGGEDAVTQQGGHVFMPQALESFTYDFDGNLTSDGRWNYAWDAENRLVSMEAIASVPVEAKQRLEFAYDSENKRIQKKVFNWNATTSSYEVQSVIKFVYDGWNLAAEVDGSNALVRSYTWGQDRSGTLDGAGGIGGLLSIQSGGSCYQVGYDGNGNVVVAVNAGTGQVAALYDYDAFGNTLKAVGVFADSNPFKFSTKYADGETGLVYFGYRYYQPQTGRWLSRDPSSENGGFNLYAYVNNNPVSFTDPLGLWSTEAHEYILDQAFGSCLTGPQIQKLKDASYYVDDFWKLGQIEYYSYEHGMRAGAGQSEAEARLGASAFISYQETLARSYAKGTKNGYHNIPLNAIYELGQALHTIMDETSPAHEGFQIWEGPPYPTFTPLDFIRYKKWYDRVLAPHEAKETLERLKSDGERLKRVKKDVRDEFIKIFGDCGTCVDKQ